MPDPLPPGATIGILGGGQLGRMLALAAARLGLRAAIYDPDPAAPAKDVTPRSTTAPWTDAASLAAFARAADVLTFEFENIPSSALDAIAGLAPLFPPRPALEISQDRLSEKALFGEEGLTPAPHAAVDDLAALTAALGQLGTPGRLKTRRLGYDGKGQRRIAEPGQAAAAWHALAPAGPLIYEREIAFTHELSVIAARGKDGQLAAFDPSENRHDDGILRTTTVPARLPRTVLTDAVLATARLMERLDYVGVIGVEFFWGKDGLIANEYAPRVHNSGHWTEAACLIDQFEQHIRAVAGWPLGDGRRHADVTMENLLGDAAAAAPTLKGALHLYGKAETRPGRKMGHITRLTPKP